jgi:dihydropteroate synthase
VSGAGSTVLRLRGHSLRLEPGRPVLMGVVNASPESFYDGARRGALDLDVQVERALSLAEAGAGLIDVGGESGVTDRPAVSAGEEASRLVPLVERLADEGLLVSVDTWKAEVARAALDAGAVLVNDVSGLSDPEVALACADSGAGLVVTHTRAAPKTKAFPAYRDVIHDVAGFLLERMATARDGGVGEEQILLDPGPDLAKTPAETVEVLRALDRLPSLGRPVLLAVSRKDFVGAICGRSPAERLAGTLAAVGEGVDAGAAVVRTHDVAEVTDFLAVRAALRGEREVAAHLRVDERLRREESAA